MYSDYYKIKDYILLIEANDNAITQVGLVDKIGTIKTCSIIEEFKLQLDLYFEGNLKQFDINYEISYLPWRKKLYSLIQQIGFGETVPIKSLLEPMGLDKGARAISRAMNENPLILIIPCHRVSSTIRKLNAYSYSTEFRNFLLEIEK